MRDYNELIQELRGFDTPADNDVLTWSGRPTWSAPSGVSDVFTLTKVTSDQPFTSTTVSDVTNMAFSVTSGVYYSFRFLVLFQSNTGSRNISLTLTTPTFTTFGATVKIPSSGDAINAIYEGYITSSGDEVIPGSSIPATNTSFVATVEGTILPSANGTVQLRAGVTSTAGNPTITVKQGSVGVLTKFA